MVIMDSMRDSALARAVGRAAYPSSRRGRYSWPAAGRMLREPRTLADDDAFRPHTPGSLRTRSAHGDLALAFEVGRDASSQPNGMGFVCSCKLCGVPRR